MGKGDVRKRPYLTIEDRASRFLFPLRGWQGVPEKYEIMFQERK